jgi:lysophospholipase L1-like esterase
VLTHLREALGAGRIPEDWVAVNCGLHDIKRERSTGALQVEPDAYRQNLREIATTVAAAGKKLLWIRTTPVDEVEHARHSRGFDRLEADLEACNRTADEVMEAAEVPLIDLHGFTAALPGPLFRDHVHFHPWVSRAQAGFLRRELDRLLRPELPSTVAFLGDSITDAGHARENPEDPGQGYLASLAGRMPQTRLLNYGISGNRLEDVRARMESIPMEASTLVLYGGINDVVHIFKRDRPQTVEAFAAEFEGLLDDAARLGIPLRVIIPFIAPAQSVPRAQPWWPLPGDGHAAWVRELAPRQTAIQAACEARDIPCLPLQPLLGDSTEPLSEDGVHPTPEGHARLGEAVADWLV